MIQMKKLNLDAIKNESDDLPVKPDYEDTFQ